MSPITTLFGIRYPIIQAGMVWVSGGNLAAAAANTGCLGLIGAGSMDPDLLGSQIKKCRKKTSNPFGINLPLIYSKVEEQIEVALKNGVKIFFTSAGSPKKYTQDLKKEGAIVVHVVSSPKLALKCLDAGVDAIVAEGFEAGGHNGRDELTTMTLIPQVVDSVNLPIIAAGGIANGRQMAAALALGAGGVQIGSAFAATEESSAHQNFKNAIVQANSEDTMLLMKKHIPVRLLKNKFFHQVELIEEKGGSKEELVKLLGKGRAKKGMLEGDLDFGELEIGQVSAQIKTVLSCQQLVDNLLKEYKNSQSLIKSLDF